MDRSVPSLGARTVSRRDGDSIDERVSVLRVPGDRPAVDGPADARTARDLNPRDDLGTLFSNHYTYGDLKASPSDLLERYFHASLYFAHWHIVEVAFRFPKSAVDLKTLRHLPPSAAVRRLVRWLERDAQ